MEKLEDQNGDGYVDLLVSANTYEDNTGGDTGLFYVIFLGHGMIGLISRILYHSPPNSKRKKSYHL